jgi:hypothetical protein
LPCLSASETATDKAKQKSGDNFAGLITSEVRWSIRAPKV